jgi:hypothetical protein
VHRINPCGCAGRLWLRIDPRHFVCQLVRPGRCLFLEVFPVGLYIDPSSLAYSVCSSSKETDVYVFSSSNAANRTRTSFSQVEESKDKACQSKRTINALCLVRWRFWTSLQNQFVIFRSWIWFLGINDSRMQGNDSIFPKDRQ